MNNKNKCRNCGSKKMMTGLKIVDHGYMDTKHDLAVEFDGKPDALIFKKTRRGILKATICGECGRVDLSVDNPGELWELFKKNRKD